jgi:metallophosphoesterase (TIGR00282 family)
MSNIIRVLALGDIIGHKSIEGIKQNLSTIKKAKMIDFVIANGENASYNSLGISRKNYEDLISAGVDVITSGNHIWKNKEVFEFIDKVDRLIRPINYVPSLPGKGKVIVEVKGIKVCVMNLIGSTFMDAPFISPFFLIQQEINNLPDDVKIVIIDFHAEATAEKVAMGWFLDGRVSLVFGTHTHVQTADEKILPNGTGYITDIGMCGFTKSVIGDEVERSLKRFLLGLPERLSPSEEGSFQMNGIIVDIDTKTGKTVKIERISYEFEVY